MLNNKCFIRWLAGCGYAAACGAPGDIVTVKSWDVEAVPQIVITFIQFQLFIIDAARGTICSEIQC